MYAYYGNFMYIPEQPANNLVWGLGSLDFGARVLGLGHRGHADPWQLNALRPCGCGTTVAARNPEFLTRRPGSIQTEQGKLLERKNHARTAENEPQKNPTMTP